MCTPQSPRRDVIAGRGHKAARSGRRTVAGRTMTALSIE
ncbi:MAG: hypothetical protein OJF60_002919 [Burkholderiaceae bacterium]|nr:MAG: hypothetical protein OJF60_002919 [Burkholderiaceae bacterium]